MIAVLHNIRSMYNVGAIFRTADAMGLERVYLGGITPAPIDRFGKERAKIVKVSLGAENLPWEKATRTAALLKKLRKQGYKIFAIEQSPGSIPYHKVRTTQKFREKVCLVVGHERAGLPKSILDLADKILEIPMNGKKESLNVSIAFAIVGFHLINL